MAGHCRYFLSDGGQCAVRFSGGSDAGILLGDDVDAGVLARQRVAKPVRAVRRAVVDDDDLELQHLLGKDGFHGGAQGRLGIVRNGRRWWRLA